MARKRPALRQLIEPLEKRLLLSGINQNLGQLDGRFWTQGSVFNSAHSDEYHFTLARAGAIDIQLSRLIGTAAMTLDKGKEFPAVNFLSSTRNSTDDQEIKGNLGAGNYILLVEADQSQLIPSAFYTLAIAPDFAPGAQFSNLDFRADTARDLGVLSEESTNSANDFIGYLDTNDHPANDLIDTYSFNVPASGTLALGLGNLSLTDQADSGARFRVDFALYRDSNNDGRLQPSEMIAGASSDGDPETPSRPIAPGKYFVVVSELQRADPFTTGGTNYRLDLFYNAFDFAGNTLPTAKAVSLNATPQTFHDYISSVDPTDIYKFTTSTGGPFIFNASLSGDASRDFDLQLV